MHLSDVLSALESIVGLKDASPVAVVEEVVKLAAQVVEALEASKVPASAVGSEPVAVSVVPPVPAVPAAEPSSPVA